MHFLYFSYLNKNYNFQLQMDTIDYAKYIVKKFLREHTGKPILVIVGSYLIGKEKVWISLAEHFNMKVWLEPQRLKAIECIYEKSDSIFKSIVKEEKNATIHVLSMAKMTYKV